MDSAFWRLDDPLFCFKVRDDSVVFFGETKLGDRRTFGLGFETRIIGVEIRCRGAASEALDPGSRQGDR